MEQSTVSPRSAAGSAFSWARAASTVPLRAGTTTLRTLLATAASVAAVAGLSVTTAAVPAAATPPPAGVTIAHWGTFTGDGDPAGQSLRPTRLNLPGQVVGVSSSNTAQYALLANGSLYAWGQGGRGQLGDGSLANSLQTAVRVHFPAGVKIAFIPTDVMPYNGGLAVDTTGRAWGWGQNMGGELCLGNHRRYTTPVRLPLTHVTALASGYNHAVYDANGRLYACGTDKNGELGDGRTQTSEVPVKVSGLAGKDVSTLVASFGNGGALLTDGQYYDWGYDAGGQLGDGVLGTSSDVPVLVHLPHPVTQVAQGGSIFSNGQTLVMLSTGAIWAWGEDNRAQLGNGTTGTQAVPARLTPPAGVVYRTLASAGSTSYAITTSGAVWAWGRGTLGELGDGKKQDSVRPVKVATGAVGISATADDAVVLLGGN